MKKLFISILLVIVFISCFVVANASSKSGEITSVPIDIATSDTIISVKVKEDMIDEKIAEELFVSNGFSQKDKREQIVLKAEDPKSTKDVKDIMKELCKENVTFFFSSHVLEVVEKLCDEVAIIKDGKILEVGSVDKIKGNKDLTDAFLEKTYEK